MTARVVELLALLRASLPESIPGRPGEPGRFAEALEAGLEPAASDAEQDAAEHALPLEAAQLAPASAAAPAPTVAAPTATAPTPSAGAPAPGLALPAEAESAVTPLRPHSRAIEAAPDQSRPSLAWAEALAGAAPASAEAVREEEAAARPEARPSVSRAEPVESREERALSRETSATALRLAAPPRNEAEQPARAAQATPRYEAATRHGPVPIVLPPGRVATARTGVAEHAAPALKPNEGAAPSEAPRFELPPANLPAAASGETRSEGEAGKRAPTREDAGASLRDAARETARATGSGASPPTVSRQTAPPVDSVPARPITPEATLVKSETEPMPAVLMAPVGSVEIAAAARSAGANATALAAPPETVPLQVEWLAARGGGSARVRLHPPHLGEIELRVRIRGNVVEVIVNAPEEAARVALHGQRDSIAEALSTRALRMEHFEVGGGQSDLSQSGEDSRPQADPEWEGFDRRAMPGAGAPQAPSPRTAPLVAPPPATGGASRVDLRI